MADETEQTHKLHEREDKVPGLAPLPLSPLLSLSQGLITWHSSARQYLAWPWLPIYISRFLRITCKLLIDKYVPNVGYTRAPRRISYAYWIIWKLPSYWYTPRDETNIDILHFYPKQNIKLLDFFYKFSICVLKISYNFKIYQQWSR